MNTQDRPIFPDNIPEDIEKISELLLDWCEKLPEINGALEQVRRSLPDDELMSERPAGGKFPTPEAKAEYEKNVKEEVLNALRKSSPPPNSVPTHNPAIRASSFSPLRCLHRLSAIYVWDGRTYAGLGQRGVGEGERGRGGGLS